MEVDEFLEKLGMRNEQHNDWSQIIAPPKVVIIFGKKGSGKTALGMYLLEALAKDYYLQPVVVNFPRSKQELLPATFAIKTLGEIKGCDNSVILIDEGSTLIPAGQAKLEEMIKAFSALSRQREQIIILIFHATADVGSRILRGVDTLIFKEPSLRQIQWGSKDDFLRQLLLEAKEKLANRGAQYCYVDSDAPEFRDILENPLPTFWSDLVSKAWAGVDTDNNSAYNLFTMGSSPSPQRRRWVTEPLEIEPIPQAFAVLPRYSEGILIAFTVQDPEGRSLKRAKLAPLIHKEYPGVSIEELMDARIEYYDYTAVVTLRR